MHFGQLGLGLFAGGDVAEDAQDERGFARDLNLAASYELYYLKVTTGAWPVYAGPYKCGDPGTYYRALDLNHDCYIDLLELQGFATAWLTCTDPASSAQECQQWYQ